MRPLLHEPQGPCGHRSRRRCSPNFSSHGGMASHELGVRYAQGPYARALGPRYDTTTLPVAVGTQVLLGGAPIEIRGRRWQLRTVRPTNVPAGLKVMATAGMQVPPALGIVPMQWVRHTAHQPIRRLPIASLTTDAEPELVVEPTKPGRYIIDGFLVTYGWDHTQFTDYARTQFVICAYQTAQKAKRSGCSVNKVPPPPSLLD